MHKHDDPTEDYKKALWYLNDYDEHLGEKIYDDCGSLWDRQWVELAAKAGKFFNHEPEGSVLTDIFYLAFKGTKAVSVNLCIAKVQLLLK